MAVIKEIAEQEKQRMASGVRRELHLYREGTFLRAYEWSAWLACRFLHDFKVSKRRFKGADEPVVYIGFPEGSLLKWLPEGAEQHVAEENHLVLTLPDLLMADSMETIDGDYAEWRDAIPLMEARERSKKGSAGTDSEMTASDLSTTAQSLSAIIVPQTIAASTQFIEVKLNTSNATYTYAIPSGGKTFAGGNAYTYTLTLGLQGVSVTTSISSWTNGTNPSEFTKRQNV